MKYDSCSALGFIEPGSCIGHWESGNKDCLRCLQAGQCEEKSKSTGVTVPVVDTMAHLLQVLDVRFLKTMERKGDIEKTEFKDTNGTLQFVMLHNLSSGKIKFVSRNGEKVVEKLVSTKQVDKILSKLL